ncbi:Cytochrome c, mono-and diheme variants [Polaromonas sp. YR568]|uniref:cytochrome c n=1 Tax=Polaromonas sp. YR568 TaxID=1855301 RepID=UPI0008E1C540|nr:cytochrome c [Polaromonas sp. YR568]SFV00296.1 Cytochrome c, mono-and diheme variants [Polaromonas sp. YR568]
MKPALSALYGNRPVQALLLAAAALLAGCGKPEPVNPAVTGVPASMAKADQVTRGRYLAKAADCAACHTAADGAPFAGGFELASPFGNFYGTNITPDKEHGIGKWSADDFYRALHDGVAPGKQLYPAMPYTSYRGMTREDSDAIYAYLMQQKPAAVPNREPELKFPYNMRFGIRFWNWVFLEDALPDASAGQSLSWQRGRYLSNAMGHCAECHTPRSFPGQLNGSKPLQGAALGRVAAPDITPAGLAARGWTGADLQTFFRTGMAPQGSAWGEMFPVIHFSTQYLSTEDLAAIATYLTGDVPLAPKPLPAVVADTGKLVAGRQVYLAVCAGCHGREGEGKPHVAVAMKGNSTVRDVNPHNLIVSVLDGIEAQKFPGTESMQKMPGFAGTLSDAEVAQLSNYLRATWGGLPDDIEAEKVGKLRAAAGKH